MTNSLFASYVTGSAFRIDLSKRMVWALVSASQGAKLNNQNFGVPGLIERGIMEIMEGQEKRHFKDVRLTDAGIKVAELCAMAGLVANRAKDAA